MTGIRRLLVANRGEIARRVFATCRRLGIETVAVFSDADSDLPFVREADVAVRLPGSSPAQTYLRGDSLIAAARASGADAVHPGYGFLSENAGFARQVVDAGLTWVGPRPRSIEQMGSKIEAKKLVAEVGVPVLVDLSPADVTEEDLPLLVKASAGGGGRGMRIVRSVNQVAPAVEQASAEAASAFGDATVFCEPYVEHGRHVEVQVVADAHGALMILGERDCSIQRRHQKVVEETPAPWLSDELRKAMHDAARRVAESVDYVGAGTVEFLLDPATERFWFLEMNTRLQVEHTVTECVTGLDLVALQIAVAEGQPLGELVETSAGSRQARPADAPQGHAVEVRLYAEDPASDWQPQSGRLTRFEIPGIASEFTNPSTYGVRLDAGFTAGDEVGTHYDAMLAKVIAWAPTREQALRQLAGALSRARIHGVRTNRDLLVNLLRHEAVVAGEVSTDFLDRHDLVSMSSTDIDVISALAAAIALAERSRLARSEQRRIPAGWRNVVSQPQTTTFTVDDREVEVGWYGERDGYRCAERDDVHVVTTSTDRVVLAIAGVTRTFDVFVDGDRVDVESSLGHVALERKPRFMDPADHVASGSLLAPMPGSVTQVAVEKGDTVAAGQTVIVLEAMKMQHTVSAPNHGVVTEIDVSVGDQVASGTVLAVVQAEVEASGGETHD